SVYVVVLGYVYWLQVIIVDHAVLVHLQQWFGERFIVYFPDKDNRKVFDDTGLYQREDFKELVHGAQPAGHDDKSERILDKQDFAYKEVPHIDPSVHVWIGLLFVRQLDVTANRNATIFPCTPVCGFHNAGATPCQYRYAGFSKFLSHFIGLLIVGMIFFESG